MIVVRVGIEGSVECEKGNSRENGNIHADISFCERYTHGQRFCVCSSVLAYNILVHIQLCCV